MLVVATSLATRIGTGSTLLTASTYGTTSATGAGYYYYTTFLLLKLIFAKAIFFSYCAF
jgi:hypothetical protein